MAPPQHGGRKEGRWLGGLGFGRRLLGQLDRQTDAKSRERGVWQLRRRRQAGQGAGQCPWASLCYHPLQVFRRFSSERSSPMPKCPCDSTDPGPFLPSAWPPGWHLSGIFGSLRPWCGNLVLGEPPALRALGLPWSSPAAPPASGPLRPGKFRCLAFEGGAPALKGFPASASKA